MKLLHETFKTVEELVQYVQNGRITVEKSGSVSYRIDNYKLKNDTEFRHTGYGWSCEDDNMLSKRNVPRHITLTKGTKVSLTYGVYSNVSTSYISIELNHDRDYKFNFKFEITDEQFKQQRLENQKLFANILPLEFNCIGNKYITVVNNVASYSN